MTEQCQEWIAHCVTKYPCKGSVLEVGSFDVNGNPRHHFADKERFDNYIGVDMREGPCVDKVMNVQALDFANDSFGVIVDAERLEHDNRFWLSVKELYRVLKPGGHIIVTTRSWGGMHPHAYPHDYWRFMDSGLKDLLEYAGFTVLATAYGERWAGGDKAVFAVGRKPLTIDEPTDAVPYSIVIPSKNIANVTQCIAAIRKNEPRLDPKRIIVVDDGLTSQIPDVTTIKGEEPFIFSRNANLGIKAANSGVILLNDDAVLETMYGFTHLWKQRDHGLVSAEINGVVGNVNQLIWPLHRRTTPEALRPEPIMLCFVCVLIPKWVQDKIGLLDERFIGYGFDDNDYCKRAKDAGVGMSVYAGCVVEHKTLPSTFRTKPGWKTDMQRAQRIFQEKYA